MAMKIQDFQGLNKFKPMKKGVFFTIDSVIAGSIIIIVIISASSFYATEQPYAHLSYLSKDLIYILNSITVEDISNEYLNSLINDGTIKNKDNTVLEQIGEFWADGDIVFANKSVSNVTEPLVPKIFGFGVFIDNETIYKRNIPIKKSLVSSKKIISGIAKGQTSGKTRENPPTLFGPVIAEVRVWQ